MTLLELAPGDPLANQPLTIPDEDLQAGRLQRVQKRMSHLLEQMKGSIESGPGAGWYLGSAAALRAVAEAGLGNERPTVTDANVLLGRINAERPIGGKLESLDVAAADQYGLQATAFARAEFRRQPEDRGIPVGPIDGDRDLVTGRRGDELFRPRTGSGHQELDQQQRNRQWGKTVAHWARDYKG